MLCRECARELLITPGERYELGVPGWKLKLGALGGQCELHVLAVGGHMFAWCGEGQHGVLPPVFTDGWAGGGWAGVLPVVVPRALGAAVVGFLTSTAIMEAVIAHT